MIVNRVENADYRGTVIETVKCPACGGKRGEDFEYFPWHLLVDHGPEDFGLSPVGGRRA